MQKIAVLMSGGVDSSVVALLLKQQGYLVCGITMQITADDSCVKKAKNVCESIGIEHFSIDLRLDFKNIVLDYFAKSYENGQTPNPCVICNETIKFKKIYEYAKSLGIDKIATGHYGIVENINHEFCLKKSTNRKKDQSYFLSRVDEDLLKNVIFPLGEYDKKAVREIAEQFNLPPKNDKDSQDICFLQGLEYSDYLKNQFNLKVKKGNFLDLAGTIIGSHDGIHHYTVGQRKGLGAFGKPMLVKNINNETGNIILCEKGEEFLSSAVISSIKFFSAFEKYKDEELTAKIRYSQNEIAIEKMEFIKDKATIYFKTPQRAVTPGQFLVCYNKEIVLFNGEIMQNM